MRTFNRMLYCASAIALAGSFGAHAQEDENERKLATVTVTGSAIAGTPEDAALPVDVLTAADLKLEGNPTITELIRNLGVSSGVDGQTNQFASNGLEGTSNVNLRGLGSQCCAVGSEPGRAHAGVDHVAACLRANFQGIAP